MKYKELPMPSSMGKLSLYVFAREGVDRGVYDMFKAIDAAYGYMENQRQKLVLKCGKNRELLKSELLKVMDEEAPELPSTFSITEEDFEEGNYYPPQELSGRLNAQDRYAVIEFSKKINAAGSSVTE